MNRNQHGLSRAIPETIKRDVRRKCGFGCVICGTTIAEYEHFHPDFVNAQVHDADGIALLCPTDHAKVTKGIIPKDQVADAVKSPRSLSQGFSKDSHPYFKGIPNLKFGGGALVSRTPIPLCVKGVNVVAFDEPEDGSDVARISASLQNASGDQCLLIEDNEWKVLSGDWDFEQKSNRYIFKGRAGDIFLQIQMRAPDALVIERLATCIHGIPIEITEEKMMIGTNTFYGGVMSNCRVGMMIG